MGVACSGPPYQGPFTPATYVTAPCSALLLDPYPSVPPRTGTWARGASQLSPWFPPHFAVGSGPYPSSLASVGHYHGNELPRKETGARPSSPIQAPCSPSCPEAYRPGETSYSHPMSHLVNGPVGRRGHTDSGGETGPVELGSLFTSQDSNSREPADFGKEAQGRLTSRRVRIQPGS